MPVFVCSVPFVHVGGVPLVILVRFHGGRPQAQDRNEASGWHHRESSQFFKVGWVGNGSNRKTTNWLKWHGDVNYAKWPWSRAELKISTTVQYNTARNRMVISWATYLIQVLYGTVTVNELNARALVSLTTHELKY